MQPFTARRDDPFWSRLRRRLKKSWRPLKDADCGSLEVVLFWFSLFFSHRQIQLYGYNAELYANSSEARHKSQGLVGIAVMVQVILKPDRFQLK